MGKQTAAERKRVSRARLAAGVAKKQPKCNAQRLRESRARRRTARQRAPPPFCPEVLTADMKATLGRRAKAFARSTQGLFTVLLVACAFCGTCAFLNEPKGNAKFSRVAPVGELQLQGGAVTGVGLRAGSWGGHPCGDAVHELSALNPRSSPHFGSLQAASGGALRRWPTPSSRPALCTLHRGCGTPALTARNTTECAVSCWCP